MQQDAGVDAEGLVMCIEVEGPGQASTAGATRSRLDPLDGNGFEIHSVQVLAGGHGSAGSTTSNSEHAISDIEVKPIIARRAKASANDDEARRAVNREDSASAADEATFPMFLGANDQHNFLYAVTFTSEAAQRLHRSFVTRATSGDLSVTNGNTTVPIAITESPSQRYIARFGDASRPVRDPDLPFENESTYTSQATGLEPNVNPWLRHVVIVVRGRPVRRSLKPTHGAYDVPDSAGTNALHASPVDESPTGLFDSRWNCVIEMSPSTANFAPRRAIFDAASTTSHATASLPLMQRLSLQLGANEATTTSKRNSRRGHTSAASTPARVIAGSKRHAASSLASRVEALASVAVSTSSVAQGSVRAAAPSLGSLPDIRPLPSTPPVPLATPGVTGPSRRFFSMPAGVNTALELANPGSPAASKSRSPNNAAYPSQLSARPGSVSFNSPREQRSVSAEQPSQIQRRANPAPSTTRPNGLGIQQPGFTPANSGANYSSYDSGSILVSVSLQPLRTVKSSREREQRAAHASTAVHRSDGSSSTQLSPNPDSPDVDTVTTARNGLTPRFQFPNSPSLSRATSPFSTRSSPDPAFTSSSEHSRVPLTDTSSWPTESDRRSWRTARVGLLDIFLVEVFVLNRSDQVKRFTVGVPSAATVQTRQPFTTEDDSSKVATIVALENNVRIG